MPSNRTRLSFFIDPMLGIFGVAKDTQKLAEFGQKFGNTVAKAGSNSNEKKYTASVINEWTSSEEIDKSQSDTEYQQNVIAGVIVLLIISMIIVAIWQA